MIPHRDWVLSQSEAQDAHGGNNHAVQHIKSWSDEVKINMSKLIAYDAIKPRQTPGPLTGGALAIHRQMPLLKEQRKDLNNLKEPPRRKSRMGKEG